MSVDHRQKSNSSSWNHRSSSSTAVAQPAPQISFGAITADDPYVLTLLQAPPGYPQRKTVTPRGSKHSFPPLVWAVHLIRCTRPEQLGAWLKRLEYEPSCILIRGCPSRGTPRLIESPDALDGVLATQRKTWSAVASLYQRQLKFKRTLKYEEREATPKGERDVQKIAEINRALSEGFESLERHGWFVRRKSVFREVPRQWVWLDIDQGLNLPPTFFDLSHAVDHHSALRWIVQRGLPEPFHEASFVGQWSSSAFTQGAKVKAHFAFLLNQPLDEGAWKAWHGTKGVAHWPLRWDLATFRTVQPHFTAAPLFQEMEPTLKRRTFFVPTIAPLVSLPKLSTFKLMAQGRALIAPQREEPIAEGNQPVTKPARKRVSSPLQEILSPQTRLASRALPSPLEEDAVYALDLEGLSSEMIRVLRAQHAHLSSATEGARNQTLYQVACRLGRYYGGDQLSLSRLIQTVLSGAQQCGLWREVGEAECLRQIHNGVRWGRRRPLYEAPTPPTISLKDERYSFELGREVNMAVFQAGRHPHKIPVLALTCGGGKTTALCAQVAREVSQGKTRVVLCRNHEMAHAFLNDTLAYAGAQRINLRGKFRLLEGMERHCTVLKEAPLERLPALKKALIFGRKALCGQGRGRCSHAQGCAGAQRPQVLRGGLTVATHSMAPILEYPAGTVAIIDELPTPVSTHHLNLKELSLLTPQRTQLSLPIHGSIEAWRMDHPQLVELASSLKAILISFGHSPSFSQQDYGQSLSSTQALTLLKPLQSLCEQVCAHPQRPLPLPTANVARRGLWPAIPHPHTLFALKRLSEGIASDQWPEELSLHWRGRESWIEYRRPFPLPKCALVGLDGTAQRTSMLWEKLAELTERSAEVWPIAAVGEAPLFARWIKTQQMRTPQLIRRDEERRVHWRMRAVGSLKRVVYSIAMTIKDAQIPPDHSVGILAAKHVADLFRLAFDQEASPQFDPSSPPVVEVISECKKALGDRQVVIGHVGAHDIGSNLYHGVDLLVMIGSSKPDWGSTLADLRALGVDEEACHEVYTHIVAARDVQALARARHLRRERVALLYIGDMSPPTGHDLPDVRWTQIEPAHPQANDAQLSLEENASALLLEQGHISVPHLCRTFSISRGKAIALCQRLTRRYELLEWTIKSPGKGRPSRAFGLPAFAPQSANLPLEFNPETTLHE